MNPPLHSRLAAQVQRHFGDPESVPPEWRGLLAEIDRSYREQDDSSALIDKALALTSAKKQKK